MHKPTRRERPGMQDYGITDDDSGLLTWAWVGEQMTKSRNYWVCTTTPTGDPHSAPVWGVWLDDQLIFGTNPQSRKARNFTHNPNVVIHLESGDDVVIFHGTIASVTDADLLTRMADVYEAKYQFRPKVEPGSAYYTLVPHKALAWLEYDFPKTATRFGFD